MKDALLSPSIQPYLDRNEIAGAVLFVANAEGIVHLEPVGWADIEARRPMTPETLFWVASQTKPIVAAAMMMLVDEGRLSLRDPVEKYLPEFAGQMYTSRSGEEEALLRKPGRPMTVEDLLLHTSGLPYKTPVEEPTLDLLPLATAVRSYAMVALDFEPGTGIIYSNAGYNTAGRVIEVITGQFFDQFLDERLFGPLGMGDTTFWPDEEQAARLAQAYGPDAQEGHLVKAPISFLYYPLSDISKRYPFPAGGLFSTARDMTLFYRMILNGGSLDGRVYLAPETVREMTRRHTPPGWYRSQGYGFMADGASYGHGGAYGTETRVDRASGLILGWLIQQASFHGEGANARDAFEKAAIATYGKA